MFRAPGLGPVGTDDRIMADLFEAITVLEVEQLERTQHERPQSAQQSEACSNADPRPVNARDTQKGHQGQQEGFHQLHSSMQPLAHTPLSPFQLAGPSKSRQDPVVPQEYLGNVVHKYAGCSCYDATNNAHKGKGGEEEQLTPTEVERLLPGIEQDDEHRNTSSPGRHYQQQNDDEQQENDKEQQQDDGRPSSRWRRFLNRIEKETLPQHEVDAQHRYSMTIAAETVGSFARHQQRDLIIRKQILRMRMVEAWLATLDVVGLGTQEANNNQATPRPHPRRWFIPRSASAPGGSRVDQTPLSAIPPQNSNASDPAAKQDDNDAAQASRDTEDRDNA